MVKPWNWRNPSCLSCQDCRECLWLEEIFHKSINFIEFQHSSMISGASAHRWIQWLMLEEPTGCHCGEAHHSGATLSVKKTWHNFDRLKSTGGCCAHHKMKCLKILQISTDWSKCTALAATCSKPAWVACWMLNFQALQVGLNWT